MATETVVADHPALSQEVEKEVVKKIEAESGYHPPKESDVESSKSEAPESEKESEGRVDEEPKTVTAAVPTEEKIEEKVVSVELPQEKVEVEEKVEDVRVVEPDAAAAAEKQDSLSEPEPSEDKLEVVNVAEVIEEKGETPAQVVEEETAEPAPFVDQSQVEKETPEAEAVQDIIDNAEDAKLPKEEPTYPSEPPVSQVEEEKVDEAVEVQQEKAADHAEIEAKTQVPQETSVVPQELLHSEEKPTEDAKTSVSQPEAAEEVAKDEATPRDIDLVADNGIEKCETTSAQVEEVKETEAAAEPVLVEEKIKETEADAEPKLVEEKIKETEAAAEPKLVEEKIKETEAAAEPILVEEKIKETVEATEAKLEEEKQVPEAADAVVPNPEYIKDSEDTKATEQDVPKEEVPVKTQKQSIVKIMKQSLVKAKKAIIGKSHNSKTPAPEAKDDGNK